MEQTPVQESSAAPGDVPAGWYQDPDDPAAWRWWDGTTWGARMDATNQALRDRVASDQGMQGQAVYSAQISDPTKTGYAALLQPDLDEDVQGREVSRGGLVALVATVAAVFIVVVSLGTWAFLRANNGTEKATDGSRDGSPSAEDVVETLQTGGLPVGDIQVYTKATDPDGLQGRPGLYVEKANFRDLGVEDTVPDDRFAVANGGSVEVYATAADAESRFPFVSSNAEGEHVVRAGAIIMRLSPEFRADQAAAYENILIDTYGTED